MQHKALGGLDVELELIPAAEPAAVAHARLDAGEALGGVLIGDDLAAAGTNLGGFTEEIRL